MEYRNLGNTGLKVSAIGLGCNNFGSRVSEQESISVVRRAMELGVNYYDTADWYGQRGLSETYLGKAINGKRSEVILATKFGMPMGEGPNDQGCSRYHIIDAVEGSLKRLGTDYIDLYQIHRPDPDTPIDETLHTLNMLVKSGKVRYIGCSDFPAWQVCDGIWRSKVNGYVSFVTVQYRYNLLDRSIEQELVPCCETNNVGIIPSGPLAGGFLTGKYQRAEAPPTGSRLAKMSTYRVYHSQENFDKLDNLTAYARERGHNLLELTIGWLLSHGWLSSVILGAMNPDQVATNIASDNWSLIPSDVEAINQIVGNGPKEIKYGDRVKKQDDRRV